MRPFAALTILLATTTLAAAQSPLCALPAADPAAVTTAVAPSSPQPAPDTNSAALAGDLLRSAFVRHVQSSGASISDLGTAHGLRKIAARSGDQFMVFQLAPDGSAAVSGATVELSPTELATLAGSKNVTELGASHGFKGFFVRSGAQFQVFYATPDGERLIPGVLWDAAGKDITRQQVSNIPGAVPTVEVTGGNAADPGQMAPASVKALPLVEKTSFGTAGSSSAPRLYMLIDPQCIYSLRALQMLAPYVTSGRIQLAVVPLSVLDYEDKGESTRSALSLLSKPADQIVSAWQSRDVLGASTREAAQRLQINMQVAQAIGVRGTPTFVWRKPDGGEGRIDGIPTSIPDMLASLGN